jgi:hypothetical protein
MEMLDKLQDLRCLFYSKCISRSKYAHLNPYYIIKTKYYKIKDKIHIY